MLQKSWLRLRNLIARSLVAAGRVGTTVKPETAPATGHQSTAAVNECLKNGETPPVKSAAVEIVGQLGADLAKVVEELSVEYGKQELPKVINNQRISDRCALCASGSRTGRGLPCGEMVAQRSSECKMYSTEVFCLALYLEVLKISYALFSCKFSSVRDLPFFAMAVN